MGEIRWEIAGSCSSNSWAALRQNAKIDDAIKEVLDRSPGTITFGHDGGGFFIFPDQSGFWFAVHPG